MGLGLGLSGQEKKLNFIKIQSAVTDYLCKRALSAVVYSLKFLQETIFQGVY